MNDSPADLHEALEKAWKLLNHQADSMLKREQRRIELWKITVNAKGAGAALLVAGAAVGALLVKLV